MPFFYYEMILILLVVIRFASDAKTRVWASHPLMRVWGAWFFLAFISFLFHREGAFQWQRLAPLLGGGFFFFLTASYAADRNARQWLMAALLVGSLVSLVWTSVQWNVDYPYLREALVKGSFPSSERVYLEDFLKRGRILGPFFSPDLFGSYLVMIFFVSIAFWLENRRKFLLVIPLGLLAALFLTGSVGAWVSLLAGLAILSIRSQRQEKIKVMTRFLLLLLIAVVLVLWYQRSGVDSEAGSLKNSLLQRLNFWKSAWDMFCYSPLWGVGFGKFGEMYRYFKTSGAFDSQYAHNIVLQLLSELGILGGIWLGYWIAVFIKTSRGKNKVLAAGLAAFFVHNLIDYSFSVPQVADHWWIIAGLLTAVHRT